MTPDLSTLKPQRPSLYRLAPDGHSLDFFFTHCPACQGLSFPANAPGCMHCGHPTEEAMQVVRPGGGTLLEYVTLHVALVPGMQAPSIAGDIRIAEQVVEEGVIAVDDESRLQPGMALRAVAVPLAATDTYGCQFVPAQETTR
jgi:uncharacterized OB-fold protein